MAQAPARVRNRYSGLHPVLYNQLAAALDAGDLETVIRLAPQYAKFPAEPVKRSLLVEMAWEFPDQELSIQMLEALKRAGITGDKVDYLLIDDDEDLVLSFLASKALDLKPEDYPRFRAAMTARAARTIYPQYGGLLHSDFIRTPADIDLMVDLGVDMIAPDLNGDVTPLEDYLLKERFDLADQLWRRMKERGQNVQPDLLFRLADIEKEWLRDHPEQSLVPAVKWVLANTNLDPSELSEEGQTFYELVPSLWPAVAPFLELRRPLMDPLVVKDVGNIVLDYLAFRRPEEKD